MKKTVIDFKPSAFDSFLALSKDKRLGGLARRYYEELFDFPPERWGRLRVEFGKDCFVSDRHTPFVIKVVVVEDRVDRVRLYVTEFGRRDGL